MDGTTGSRGAFIVFEGLDRSGKSSQVQLLASHLRDAGVSSVETMRFPDRSTPTGQKIDAYLKSTQDIDDKTLHELFASNRFEKL